MRVILLSCLVAFNKNDYERQEVGAVGVLERGRAKGTGEMGVGKGARG